jgi:protein O-mannosyl-transferase
MNKRFRKQVKAGSIPPQHSRKGDAARSHGLESKRIKWLVPCVLIASVAILVGMVHWPVLSAQATFIDDDQYLLENWRVLNPSWESTGRFFTEVTRPSTVRGYYQPLTMVSLMLDCALGGGPDNLLPFHRTSLILHVTNTVLVILLIYALFGRIVPATIVGLLFGLHPITVEPIAWISDRKTLLSTLFAFLCLLAYIRYIRKPGWAVYGAAVLLYVLALLSKPISLMLPCVMLVLDYWPLRRFSIRCIREKIPLFAVAGGMAILIFLSQTQTAGVAPDRECPILRGLLLFCHNNMAYLGKLVWPFGLPMYDVYPETLRLADSPILIGAIGTAVGLILLAVSLRRTRGFAAGWLIYIAALLPTIQIIRFADVIASDKYAYFPLLGVWLVLGWLISQCLDSSPILRNKPFVVLAGGILGVLIAGEAVVSRRCISYWQDSQGLYHHLLAKSPNAAGLYNNLGADLLSHGDTAGAIEQCRLGLELRPNDEELHLNLGIAFRYQEDIPAAVAEYQKALEINPRSAKAYTNLGNAYYAQKKYPEAAAYYRQARDLQPNLLKAGFNLGLALAAMGDFSGAIEQYRWVLERSPKDPEVHLALGIARLKQRDLNAAWNHLQIALQIKPNWPQARFELGNLYSMQRDYPQALREYAAAVQGQPDYIEAKISQADTLLMLGDLPRAVSLFREAVQLKPDQVGILCRLALLLATSEDPKVADPNAAFRYAEQACRLTGNSHPGTLDVLAVAYAAQGRFPEAIDTATKAIQLAEAAKNLSLAEKIRIRLDYYKSGKPYRQAVGMGP